MMLVRWSPKAADDLARIVKHIRRDSPEVARRIAQTIYGRAGALGAFPNRGRIGRVEGTREVPLPPLPFIVVYRVRERALEISNILHGAQRWP